MKRNLTAYWRLIRADKPIGTLLLLWPTLAAVWLASHGHPPLFILFIFIMGAFLMRSVGCILNDCADRCLDKQVARTKLRPIAAGEVSLVQALIVCALLSLLALWLVLQLNYLTIVMAFVGFIMSAVYPFLKRYTNLPQLGLGVVFNWGILMAFTAIQNKITWVAVLFYLAGLLITVCYDTFYGMVDKEDDLKVGIKSTAILFGKHATLIVALLQGCAFILLLWVGFILRLNVFYYMGLMLWLVLTVFQHLMVKDQRPESFFKAFLNNHWSWLMIFSGIVLAYMF